MNKPVIVTEETLAAPVVSPALPAASAAQAASSGPAYAVIGGLSFSHFLNDTMQSLIPSVYPILKANYALDFTQIGLITLAFNFTTSLLQPVVGIVTDRKPQPYSLAIGMFFTFAGLIMLSVASQFELHSACGGDRRLRLGGVPSRSPRASPGLRPADATVLRRRCFRSAATWERRSARCSPPPIIVPFGQPSIAWFSLIAFVAIVGAVEHRPLVQAAHRLARRTRSRRGPQTCRRRGRSSSVSSCWRC